MGKLAVMRSTQRTLPRTFFVTRRGADRWTAFDDLAERTFSNAEMAAGWCDAFNWCLGEERYAVEEVALPESIAA